MENIHAHHLNIYGPESFPYYTNNSSYAGNGSSGTGARSGSVTAPNGSVKLIQLKQITISPLIQKSNSPKSFYQNHPLKPLNKLGSSFQSSGLVKGFHPAGRFSSFTNRNPGVLMQYGPLNNQASGRVWNNNYRYNSRGNFGGSGETGTLAELTRGPRADNMKNLSKLPAEVEHIERDEYNLKEFQIEYDNAKIFVIKSYSEDDIHKCIKYDVWSSTPNGNQKLDAAFGEADAKTSETSVKCPVFLFFSVNGSGQFVGIAEMIGQVDFSKNMDFWQLDTLQKKLFLPAVFSAFTGAYNCR